MTRVCHVYGYTPDQVLDMAYPHFKMLARRLERMEGERAFYTYLAFNDPKSLFEMLRQEHPQGTQALDVEDFLSTVNGR